MRAYKPIGFAHTNKLWYDMLCYVMCTNTVNCSIYYPLVP